MDELIFFGGFQSSHHQNLLLKNYCIEELSKKSSQNHVLVHPQTPSKALRCSLFRSRRVKFFPNDHSPERSPSAVMRANSAQKPSKVMTFADFHGKNVHPCSWFRVCPNHLKQPPKKIGDWSRNHHQGTIPTYLSIFRGPIFPCNNVLTVDPLDGWRILGVHRVEGW